MKKTVLFTLLSVALLGCTRDYMGQKEALETNLPDTRVFVQGHLVGDPATKSDLRWPYVSGEGWETARFSIRADGTTPDYKDHSSDLYYGRKPGKDGRNRGKVATDYPYGHYNDRDLDYEKKDKKTGENIGLFRYVYDPRGLKTQLAILKAPSVEDILLDEAEDLQGEIDKNKNVSKNRQKLADVNGLLGLGREYLDSHVLWYVVKEVGMKNGWHVNGAIVDYEVGRPDSIPDNVEVDIHQQEHADWAEIKTSVHVRTDAGSVVINIPLAYDDILEGDGVDVRIYKEYFEGTEYEGLNVTVTHDEKGITIAIEGINADKIDGYKEHFGDGLTVEVESFCKNDDAARIWNAVRNSAVLTTGKPCTVVGQITSAYFDDSDVVKVLNPPAGR
jgi:hypothetical protein